jgi:hypothetical protein
MSHTCRHIPETAQVRRPATEHDVSGLSLTTAEGIDDPWQQPIMPSLHSCFQLALPIHRSHTNDSGYPREPMLQDVLRRRVSPGCEEAPRGVRRRYQRE